MNSSNFLFSQGKQLQDIDFYKREFILHICCGDYPISLLFSKMINSSNVNINDLLDKLFKMSPPPLDQYFATKSSGKMIQNLFRRPSVSKTNNKNQTMLLYYYLLHYIQFYYDPNIRKIDYTPYYLNTFLFEFSDPKKSIRVNNNNITGWAEQLFQYLTSSLDIPQNQFQMILKGLLTFATQDKALYFALRPQALSILARVGAQNYISILDFSIFDVLSNIDPSILILFPPNFINSSNIDKFLQYPAVLFNSQFINLAQNLIGSTEQFPVESSLFKESNLLTLVNHSIMKRKHFTDIVFSLAHNTLMLRDFSNVENILDVFSNSPQSEFKPWLMLLDFNDLYPDQEFLMTVIPYYVDSNRKTNSDQITEEKLNISNNKDMNMLQRLKNDNSFLTYINQAIGINITIDGLSKETFPKYLSGIMRSINLSDFEHFSNLDYFLFSENDRDMDFNFLFLYFVYFYILNSFKESFSARKDSNDKNIENHLIADQIESYLHNVKFNQDLLIDIFSLLFIQDKASGEFVATIEDARVILSVLVQYAQELIQKNKNSPKSNTSDLSKIVLGFSKVQQFFILNNKLNISDCFVSTLDTIISALEKHDYEIALRFASQSNDHILLKLVQFSETIYSYIKSGYKEEIITNYVKGINEKEALNRFLLELAMSTHDKIDELSIDSNKDCLSSLIQSRQKIKNGRDSLLKSVESSEYLKDIIDEARLRMFFGGNEIYVDWSDGNDEDDGNRLITPESFPVLSNFIEHYELFVKLSIGQLQSNQESTEMINNSDQSLGLILNSIIQSDKIDSWETFTQLVGSNALEMIIMHCDLTKASKQITDLIQQQMPIISELIKMQKKYKNNVIKKDDKLSIKKINKILNLVGDKNKELNDILTSINNEKTNSNNPNISLFSKLMNDYSNCDKSTFIIVLFKLINESFLNNNEFFFTSDNLLSFLDILDDVLLNEDDHNQIMIKVTSLFIDEIINFYESERNLPFPTEFIFELRMRTGIKIQDENNESHLFSHSKSEDKSPFNILLPNFISERKKNIKLSLLDLAVIFPEKVNNEIYYFINHGITSSDPKIIIKQLIENKHVFHAQKFSENDSFLSSIFNNELLNYVSTEINKIVDNSNDNLQQEMTKFVCSLFKENAKLANYVYSKLPTNLIQPEITAAFQAITTSSQQQNNQEIQPDFIYNDFNKQIISLLHEDNSIEWIQTVVDYVLNIYSNQNEINELDDEYSIFIKRQKLNWDEEKKKDFIANVRSVLLSTIKKNYSTVNSTKDENQAFKVLNKTIEIITKISYSFKLGSPNLHRNSDDEDFCDYTGSLRFLRDFVRQGFNHRFDEKYSLRDINGLVRICIKYDDFELIKEKFLIDFLSKGSTSNVPLQSSPSSVLFVSSIRNYFIEVAKNLLLLNQTDEYTKVLEFLSQIRSLFNYDSAIDISDLLRILSHPNFFDLNFNKEIVHVEVSPLYYRVKMIIDGNMALVNKEFFKLTDKTIECFNGEKELVKFHNKYGCIEICSKELKEPQIDIENKSNSSSFAPIEDLIKNKELMKVLKSTAIETNKKNCCFDAFQSLDSAIDYVIYPALSHNHWNSLWKFLIRNISSSKIKTTIDDFLNFLKDKNLMFSLFDIQNRLQMREDAILAATEIFHDLSTWNDRANYSKILKEICENEMKSRKNEGKKPEKVSDGVLNTIYEKAAIYSEFCQFCHETKTNFDRNLDIFTKGTIINSSSRYQKRDRNKEEANSKDHMIELMAFLAFVKKNFVLGLKIARTNESCVESVIRNSIETIFYAGNNEIKTFMTELKKQLFNNSKNGDYDTISIIAVESVEKILAGKAGISRFIIDYVSGNSLQVTLLVKYGFPNEALKICNHDKQNIQIVQEYAMKINDSKLIRECRKLLS